jgi:hypothetical protein
MKHYLQSLLVAIDQLGNAWLGGNPDETISSRVGRAAIAGRRWALVLERVIDWLFLHLCGLPQHCRSSIEWDEVPWGTA